MIEVSYVRFRDPVQLRGTKVPMLTLEAGKGKVDWPLGYTLPTMYLDPEYDDIVIGEDRFPRQGGLVGQYRVAVPVSTKDTQPSEESTVITLTAE